MGDLDRRIEALERLYGQPRYEAAQERERERRTEERQAEMLARIERIREQIAEEEAAGDHRRRLAFEDLERHMHERTERGADEP